MLQHNNNQKVLWFALFKCSIVKWPFLFFSLTEKKVKSLKENVSVMVVTLENLSIAVSNVCLLVKRNQC